MDRQTSDLVQQYQAMVECSTDWLAIVDANYRYVLANETYAAAHGYCRSEIIGRHVAEILGTEHFERDIQPVIDRCFAGNSQRVDFIRIPRQGGGPRQLLARYDPIDTPESRSQQVAVAITDVTEFKRTEVRLQEHQRLVELAGRVARLGGWSVDLQTGRVEWSNVVAELHGMPHGYSPTVEECIGFCAPEYSDRIGAQFAACAEQGEPYDEELQILTADGERVWVQVTGQPIHDETGRIVRIEGTFQDITQRHAYESKLWQMQHIVVQSPAAIVVTDCAGRIEYVNPSFESISGYSRDELIGATQAVIQSGSTSEAKYQQLWQTITSGDVWSGELQNQRKNGDVYWEYQVIAPVTDDNGQITQYVAVKEDITERKAAETELRNSRDRLADALATRQALINALPAHIALLDAAGNVLDVNEQWRHYGRDNASGDPAFSVGANYLTVCEAAEGECAEEAQAAAAGLRAVIAGERDVFTLEYPCHSPDQHRWFRLMANRLAQGANEEGAAAVAMHIDVTERKLAEQELKRLAYEDALTRLPSRNGLIQALDARLQDAGWQTGASVVALDLIGLRDINDTHGYIMGDEILKDVGARLRQYIDTNGCVGRIGGDEFALFLPNVDGRPPEQRAKLDHLFNEPFAVGEVSIEVHARFGYTQLGSGPIDSEELLREAELALFHNRSANSEMHWTAYSAELDQTTKQRIELTRELRQAIAEQQFELHMQPKVDLASGYLFGCEALLRWNHPERGLQSPATFIPIAEQSQLIGPIGDWAIAEACRRIREWRDADLDIVPVAVNVSVVQLTQGHFPETVRKAIDSNAIPPWALSLEITESVFAYASDDLHSQLKALRELGVRLSLDDFGTGYSSLVYLQKFPFDEIKIDQGFVFWLLNDPYSHQVVSLVMGLADALGVDIIAEGVESPEVRDTLLQMGCTQGQGFYFSMPLAPEDFVWLLQKRQTLPLASVQ